MCVRLCHVPRGMCRHISFAIWFLFLCSEEVFCNTWTYWMQNLGTGHSCVASQHVTDCWLVFYLRILIDIRPQDRLPGLEFCVIFFQLTKNILGPYFKKAGKNRYVPHPNSQRTIILILNSNQSIWANVIKRTKIHSTLGYLQDVVCVCVCVCFRLQTDDSKHICSTWSSCEVPIKYWDFIF
jgi:hypothetical protein